jgi:hypothetical protein
LADSHTYIDFLAPLMDTNHGQLVRVSALDCVRPAPDHLSAAVLLSPPGDLRLLGHLVEGATQAPAIAAALGIDERTAADALHASLTALGTPDLTAATVRAVRIGLRIPSQLALPT